MNFPSIPTDPVKQVGAALLLALGGGLLPAHAADYPTRPVRIVVGFSPGGPTDVVARAFADEASRKFGQSFIVENKPGANTVIAASAVAGAEPDGYTLLFAATNHTTLPAVYADKVKFDAVRAFTPICMLASSPTVLVVGPKLPVKTLAEYMQAAKDQPDTIMAGTPGAGSTGHFATEKFIRSHGLKVTHVPYKGAAPAINDLAAGHLHSSFATLGGVLNYINTGKLTVLAVGATERSAFLPQVPTFEEAGGGEYSADAWYGLLAPAGTPAPIIEKLTQTAIEFTQRKENADKLHSTGMDSKAICGDAYLAEIKRAVDTNVQLAKALNLQIN